MNISRNVSQKIVVRMECFLVGGGGDACRQFWRQDDRSETLDWKSFKKSRASFYRDIVIIMQKAT